MRRLVAAFFLLAATALAQPSVNAIQNNYSQLSSGMPNYAFAQGSIATIYGANMAPAGVLSGAFNPALNKNLGGVSVKFTAGSTTTEGIPYYVSPTQLAVIIPSATPIGSGTFTVTYNNQTSAAFPVQIVQSNFGILTMNGTGFGQAAVLDTSFAYISLTNAANEGSFVSFWGTGLGADPNDETRLISNQQNQGNIPFEFYIGNKLAEVAYRGRSQYPGLDQVVVKVPTGVAGCFVSAYAKTGNYISNFVTLPVTATGKVCSDADFTTSQIQTLTSKTNIRTASLSVTASKRTVAALNQITPATNSIGNAAVVGFYQSASADYFNNYGRFAPSVGSCVLSNMAPPAYGYINYTSLGGGTTGTFRLPSGTNLPMSTTSYGFFLGGASNSSSSPLFLPESGGTYTFTGNGNGTIGASTLSVTTVPNLTWTGGDNVLNIPRAQGFDVAWTGADPNSLVRIYGESQTDTRYSEFACTVRASAGRFTIPRDLLASMIQTGADSGNSPQGTLYVYTLAPTQSFTVPGTDAAFGQYSYYHTARVRYQ